MTQMNTTAIPQNITVRHRGRGGQVGIYLGKLLRMFVYQNDWKVLPMAALIAGMVGMVMRGRMFISMEGTEAGTLALVCICIWNGFFNSIQVICRERDVIKREHRSGMHISSYIVSHMLYQMMLCMVQVGITIYVTQLTGVVYPAQGMITKWMIVDFAISMFLLTFAADMLSLWISALARSTTVAMTVMPFLLIFQLIFSGGMFSLPGWAAPITNYTIAGDGMKVIAAQADINNLPAVSVGNLLHRMRNDPINENLTFGDLMDMYGEDEIREYIGQKSAEAGYNPAYEKTVDNVVSLWGDLVIYVILYALLAMVTLEFIDKDKR